MIPVSNQYDVMDRVVSLTWKRGANQLAAFDYLYNNAGMITQKIANIGGSVTVNQYSYDDLDRLVSEDVSGSTTFWATFAYDGVGNRTTATINGTNIPYTLGIGNRLSTFGAAGSVSCNAAGCVTTLVYSAGNQLDMTWNSQYQLTGISTNGVECERNGFDALGRRVWTWDGTTTNYMVYDGVHVLAEVDGAGALKRAYTHGAGVDNWLAMTVYTGATVKAYYFVTDHLGTVHAVVDGSGTIVESYQFDAWGRVLGVFDGSGTPLSQSAIGNRILWQGREYSWNTGLYYFRARFYDPITGRWLSNDPIGISGGLNQYVFCGDNPVNFRDPAGLCTEMEPGLTDTTFDFIAWMLPFFKGATVVKAGLAMDAVDVSALKFAEGGGPKILPEIVGSRGGTLSAEKVARLKEAMLKGEYRYSSAEGRIGGYIDAEGRVMVGEGHHRMAAALETGDRSIIQQILDNARLTPVDKFPTSPMPLPRAVP